MEPAFVVTAAGVAGLPGIDVYAYVDLRPAAHGHCSDCRGRAESDDVQRPDRTLGKGSKAGTGRRNTSRQRGGIKPAVQSSTNPVDVERLQIVWDTKGAGKTEQITTDGVVAARGRVRINLGVPQAVVVTAVGVAGLPGKDSGTYCVRRPLGNGHSSHRRCRAESNDIQSPDRTLGKGGKS
jgi:hypothetical protein